MSDLSKAIRNICEEKGLSFEAVVATIEQALAAAYRKDFGQKNQNVRVEFDPETAKSKVYDIKTIVEDMPEEEDDEDEDGDEKKPEEKIEKSEIKENKIVNSKHLPAGEAGTTEIKGDKKEESADAKVVVEEVRKFNPRTELQISDARLIKKSVKVGDELKTKLAPPEEYGRMAAQTAKQVIIQRLREAEREMIFSEFKDKQGEVVSGIIQRREGRNILIDLGKSVGILLKDEQIYGENYNSGERIKVFIKEVRQGSKGAEVVLSRTSDEILKKIFYLEIPEISNGLIEIKAVAREAGSRSKVAVYTDSENVDPIGSCVGQRGARIQTIISELGGEKVDIIEWDENPVKFIANALSPAKIINIETNKDDNKATVKVAEDQLSLAIGKSGQNARLAARLTGWRVDIVGVEKDGEGSLKTQKENEDTEAKEEDKNDEKNKDDSSASSEQAKLEEDVKETKEKEDEGTPPASGQAEKKDDKKSKKKKKTETDPSASSLQKSSGQAGQAKPEKEDKK